jgi:glycosyltransferase involved in cell wall biosynthesis
MRFKRNIRIDQFLAGFSPHDAISNEALIIQDLLRNLGFISDIYAEHLHPDAPRSKRHYEYKVDNKTENLAIYHFSIGSPVTTFLAYQPIRLIVRYHNVTPTNFFTLPSDHVALHGALLGKKQLTVLDQISDCLLADSEYNLKDFTSKPGRMEAVVPILRDYERLMLNSENSQLKNTLKKSGRKHWLFVGRFAPNKCQHDLIEALKIYQEAIDKKVRLILVGSFFSHDYKIMLFNLCDALSLKYAISLDTVTDDTDVLFLPNATDELLKTAYEYSDLFLCLSEHEGFCVPIAEALYAGLPVVAYASSAIASNFAIPGLIEDKRNLVDLFSNILELTTENRNKTFFEKSKLSLRESKAVFSQCLLSYLKRIGLSDLS